MMVAEEIAANRPCDRCPHPFKYHHRPTPDHIGSECMIVEGVVFRGPIRKMPRTKPCWCDGYVPRSADG